MRSRYSLQRELIYDTVVSNPIHPTAEMVYHQLKPSHKNLSLGTVYRNLQKLTDDGKLKKFSIDGVVIRYDADTVPHYHSICLECGEVADIDGGCINNLDDKFANRVDGYIIGHNITFNIICSGCVKKN